MQTNISKELKRTFDLASLRQKTKGLRTEDDWDKANKIINQYEQEAKKQTRTYYAEYDVRVSKVIQQLMDKAAGKNRNFTHRWFGNDPFDKERLSRQAHRVVQHDHQRRMGQLEESESQELGKLLEQIEQRDQLFEKASRDFNQVVDRREGQERRIKRTR